MDYEQVVSPYTNASVDNYLKSDGAIDSYPKIDLSLSDKDLIDNLEMRVQDSLNYWDEAEGYNLRASREQNERFYLGKQIDASKLFSYQTNYVENQLFANLDAITSYLVASQPRAEVIPSNVSAESRALAVDLEKIINVHSNLIDFQGILNTAVLHAMIYKIGILKLYYDPDYGKLGEIMVKAVNPKNIVIDKNAFKGQNPVFILEKHKDSLEALISMFPKKEKEIMATVGVSHSGKVDNEIAWNELHATVYKNNKPEEWVFLYVKDVMLDKYKDVNWIYSDITQNYLPNPSKPYVPINLFNLGNHWIDDTSLLEQASLLQVVLNKRGRQIMENADTANGILTFNNDAITADALNNLTGAPNQKLLLTCNGRPIEEVVMQIPPHILPDYVIEDKNDLRGSIRTIMATPAQLIGTNQTEAGKDQTATEAVMIKNQATGRLDRITKDVERGVTEYYKLLIQLMKVHYTEKRFVVYNSEDGNFDYIEISRHTIDNDAQVFIRTGTTLPFDKGQQQTIALNLAKLDLISPLDLYKDLNMDRPQERYENWVKYKNDPMSLSQEAQNAQEDHEALVEYVRVMAGEKVEPNNNPTTHHIETHRMQMTTNDFIMKTTSKQRNALAKLVAEEIKIYNLQLALRSTTSPDQVNLPAGTAPPQQPPMPAPQPPMDLSQIMGQPPMQLPQPLMGMPNQTQPSVTPPIAPPMSEQISPINMPG